MKRTLLLCFMMMAWQAWGAPGEAAKPSSAVNLQRQHSFEDLLVQGKHHFSDEAVATVEADKVLDALIGVRKDFKDRIEQSDKRN